MGRSLDSNIYGNDSTDYAESVSSSALDTSGLGYANTNLSDYWGETKGDEDDKAKGNTPEYESPDVVILRKTMAGGGDKEKLTNPYPQNQRFPRHVSGPKTSEDKGGAISDPPPSRGTSNSGSKYPRYSKG